MQEAGPGKAVDVCVVEDHELLAESLAVVLEEQGISTRVVRPVAGQDVLVAVLAARATVVMLDLDLGAAGDGTHLIAPLRRSGQVVVVLTASTDQVRHGECLAMGASAVLPKTAELAGVLTTLRRVLRGESPMAEVTRAELIALWRAESERLRHSYAALASLTDREHEVLLALMRGERAADIAAAARVSLLTVRSQVRSVLTKLGVSSQLEAVALAWTVNAIVQERHRR